MAELITTIITQLIAEKNDIFIRNTKILMKSDTYNEEKALNFWKDQLNKYEKYWEQKFEYVICEDTYFFDRVIILETEEYKKNYGHIMRIGEMEMNSIK